jgi:hypothetical protein
MMDGYLTELYTQADFNGVSIRLWVARDFPNYKQINGQLARLRFGYGVPVKNIDLTKIPGMVMKSEAETGGTHPRVVVTSLLSAKVEPVDAAAFVIPEDYHDVNWQNEATAGAHLARIKALLKENPRMVFHKDTNGVPLLYTAAVNGEKDVVELPLANKADVNARDNTGGTALGEALIYGHLDGIQGTWKLVALENNGQQAPAEFVVVMKLVFKGDTLTFPGGEPGFTNYKFKLDPTTKPAGFTRKGVNP